MASELHAGPTVQMIFARRIAVEGNEATSWLARFREGFSFSKFVPIRFCVGVIIVYAECVL
jgi:hypothetical protein